ncbi:MAG: TM2 domain-containing protein [Candidatus Nanopelagicales bacterium]
MTSNDDRTPSTESPSSFPPPPPPPTYPTGAAAPLGTTVPVFPNGKPQFDVSGQPASPKSRLAAALLAWFLGVIGVHRFYVGKIGTGILMILTLGGLGIWILIDFVLILVGSFKDKEGRVLSNW